MRMPRRVGVIDYGAGNMFSVERGLRTIGSEARIVSAPEQVSTCDAVLLPGVGAFGAGMERMRACGMDRAVTEFVKSGKPLLGVCLGMQFLMSRSLEFGEHEGLDLIPGAVKPIEARLGWPVPNVGWCSIEFLRDPVGTPFAANATGTDFYFVHSYHCVPANDQHLLAVTDYGGQRLTAMISRDNIHGCQFHPEVSDQAGLEIYRLFEQAA